MANKESSSPHSNPGGQAQDERHGNLLDLLSNLGNDVAPVLALAKHIQSETDSLSEEQALSLAWSLHKTGNASAAPDATLDDDTESDFNESEGNYDYSSDLEPYITDTPLDEETLDVEDDPEDTYELPLGVVAVPGALIWDMANVVDDNEEFFTRRRFISHPPELILTDGTTETTMRLAINARAARELSMALGAVDRIYRGLDPVPEVKEKLGFKGILMKPVHWWMRRKVVGTFVGVIVLFAIFSFINGLLVMFLSF